MQTTESIWMNGRLVKWADATVHVASHGLHYGSGVFEGVRAYKTAGGSSIFRLSDHLRRLHDSARLLGMRIPYSVEELPAAEVTPLRSIDGVELGVGPVTEALRDEYLRCVRGTSVYAPAWLEHVTLELAA